MYASRNKPAMISIISEPQFNAKIVGFINAFKKKNGNKNPLNRVVFLSQIELKTFDDHSDTNIQEVIKTCIQILVL